MNIDNKIAVVTGGAGGIGAALCRALAEKGAKVVVSDVNIDAAQAVAMDIGGIAVACDVSRESDIQHLIRETESQLGDIDLFVSNAGFGVGEPDNVASASNDVWQKNWELHVMSHVWASRALLPKMLDRGDGYLVNTASAAGLLVQIADAAYSATKHAAVSFAESLAIGHNDDGIKVSVICPQYVDTNILAVPEDARGKQLQGVITPEDCAATIVNGIESETFMILTHPEVAEFYRNRANDPSRWVKGMRRYRTAMLDENGKFDFRKVFNI